MSRCVRAAIAAARPHAAVVFSRLTLGLVISIGAAGAAAAVTAGGLRAPQSRNALLHRVAVFGKDGRTPLPRSYRPVGAKIAVLHDRRSHSVCTAFCVAPDIVATAAHCLYRTGEKAPLRLRDVTVRLSGTHVMSGVAGVATGAPEANVVAGSTRLNVRPPIDATRDWALVRLAQPLCKAGSFKISSRSVNEVMRLARAGRVYNVAFHRDLPKWQPMIGRRCRVQRNFTDADWQTIRRDFTDPDQLLLHTCDTGGASSGSPLLVNGPDGPEVVGINVGTYVQSKVIMLNGEVVHRFKSDDVANTGVNAQAFAKELDAFKGAALLYSRRDVLRLQQALAKRGLYKGPYDGRFGAATRTAVESFERASHMPVTGLATRALLGTLVGESQVVTGHITTRARAAWPLR